MVLRRPVKYNPDKRDFVLTENNLKNMLSTLPSGKSLPSKMDLGANDLFETQSDLSKTESQISYGNRVSQFGFTDMFGQTKKTQAPIQTVSQPSKQKEMFYEEETKQDTRPKQSAGAGSKANQNSLASKQGSSLLSGVDDDFSQFNV